jgi:hypothetical protein
MAVNGSPPHTPRSAQPEQIEPIARGAAPFKEEPPRTPVRNSSLDASSVLSPERIGSSPLPRTDKTEKKTEMHETAEKTNSWASLCFGAANLFFCATAYYLYRAVRERSFYLLVPAGGCLAVSMIIGTVGEFCELPGKTETPVVPKGEKDIDRVPAFQKGQPVPLDNAGNTCFINAPTQAIMNDAQYPRVFKEICKREIDRHQNFRSFLLLFSPQKYLPAWPSMPWSKFLSHQEQKGPQDFVFKYMKDVFIRLMPRRGGLEKIYFDKTKKCFREKYPKFSAVLDLFPRGARRESEFEAYAESPLLKEVYDQQTGEVKGELRAEINGMKQDRAIIEYFDRLREEIGREVVGFRAYSSLIDAYEKASQHDQGASSRAWRMPSGIGNVRNLMQQSRGGYSQEDVDQFIRCLAKYALPDEYPEIFFPTVVEVECEEIREEDQNENLKKLLEERIAKHRKGEKPEDILSVLQNGKFTEPPNPECIFTISEALTEGAKGQVLFDESQMMRQTGNNPTDSPCVYIDNRDNKAKLFYAARGRKSIQGTPNRLVLQLGRWKVGGEKIHCTVHMPPILKIRGENYRLKSIVVHEGETVHEGHYSAFVFKNKEWWYASDSLVDKALDAHVQTALTKGYLYFYEKIEPLPS